MRMAQKCFLRTLEVVEYILLLVKYIIYSICRLSFTLALCSFLYFWIFLFQTICSSTF